MMLMSPRRQISLSETIFNQRLLNCRFLYSNLISSKKYLTIGLPSKNNANLQQKLELKFIISIFET